MSSKNLLDCEDRITTRMGKGFLGERAVYRGKDLHHDLKDLDWFELFLYGITGRFFPKNEVKMLNQLWLCTSYPDTSIWPNHITALAGTARSTASLGLSIGLCVSEAKLYGVNSIIRGLEFFYKASEAIEKGETLEQIVDQELQLNKAIYGFGRPLASLDERVPHVIGYARENSLGEGKHFQLALETFRILKRKKGLCMNLGALVSALGADMGFTKEQYHMFMTPIVWAGVPPCFIEASENKPGTFLPIRCDRIEYLGERNKKW